MTIATPRHRGGRIHERVRVDVLNGRWAPGEKLQPGLLAAHYETSTTVIREALTRLVGENFVVVEPNRGFFVPRLAATEVRDLTEVRCRIEGLAIELAIQRGDLEWESEVIAAHHQLSRTPRRTTMNPQHVDDEWANAHRRFHGKLIEACKLPVLIEISRQLSNATELYRRWAAPSPAAATRDVEQEHSDIVRAVLERDSELATRLLREHYERTVEVALESGLIDRAGAQGRNSSPNSQAM